MSAFAADSARFPPLLMSDWPFPLPALSFEGLCDVARGALQRSTGVDSPSEVTIVECVARWIVTAQVVSESYRLSDGTFGYRRSFLPMPRPTPGRPLLRIELIAEGADE